MGGQAQHVPEPMGEEERVSVALDEICRVAAEDAKVDQAASDALGSLEVEVPVFDSWAHLADGGLLDVEHELVEVALDALEPGSDRERAGHVAGIAAHFGAGIDEHDFAILECA